MLALDIGAGGTTFGKQFKKLNPKIKTVFCGDPIFEQREFDLSAGVLENLDIFVQRFSHVLSHNEIESTIEQSKSGVFKIVAKYAQIPLEDEQLDVITLNSPHPFMYPGKTGFDEFARVLKPGGIFYFGHSKAIHLDFGNEMFEYISGGEFLFGKDNNAYVDGLKFPISPVMKSNLEAKELLQRGYIKNTPGYLYGTGISKIPIAPTWKAWRKV